MASQCSQVDSSYFDENMDLLSTSDFDQENKAKKDSTDDLLDFPDSLEDQVSFSTVNNSSHDPISNSQIVAIQPKAETMIYAPTGLVGNVKPVDVLVKHLSCLFSWCPRKCSNQEQLDTHLFNSHNTSKFRCLQRNCYYSFEHE